ncbi:hypothetical protein [Methanocrinis sp.]|uniref:hypothetical protein n=1 Tax=Methanocrinis sp. TaxID=3101522 RepID=UPI003D0BFB72
MRRRGLSGRWCLEGTGRAQERAFEIFTEGVGTTEERIPSICPYCAVGCGFYLVVERERGLRAWSTCQG